MNEEVVAMRFSEAALATGGKLLPVRGAQD